MDPEQNGSQGTEKQPRFREAPRQKGSGAVGEALQLTCGSWVSPVLRRNQLCASLQLLGDS